MENQMDNVQKDKENSKTSSFEWNLEEKRAIESIMENFSCAICLSLTEKPCMPPCGHLFCAECLIKWIESLDEAVCPKCRRSFRIEDIVEISNGYSGKHTNYKLTNRRKILKPGLTSHSMRFGNIIVCQEESKKPTFKSIILATLLCILSSLLIKLFLSHDV